MRKEQIYIDLSKCTEEERKHAISLLPEPRNWKVYAMFDNQVFLNYNVDEWIVGSKFYIADKTELTYPEFIKLFDGGEEKTINMSFGITDKNMETINKQISRFEGAEFDRLSWEKITNEIGWDLPTIILWYFRKKEYQNKWIDAQKEQPLCVSTGNWDGKQSDIVLAETITGKKFLAQCYEGFMDGSAFFDWCQVDEINSNEWLVNESVSRWMKIPF